MWGTVLNVILLCWNHILEVHAKTEFCIIHQKVQEKCVVLYNILRIRNIENEELSIVYDDETDNNELMKNLNMKNKMNFVLVWLTDYFLVLLS